MNNIRFKYGSFNIYFLQVLRLTLLLSLLLGLQTPSSTAKTTTTATAVSTFHAMGLGVISDGVTDTKIPPDKINIKAFVPKPSVVHASNAFTFKVVTTCFRAQDPKRKINLKNIKDGSKTKCSIQEEFKWIQKGTSYKINFIIIDMEILQFQNIYFSPEN